MSRMSVTATADERGQPRPGDAIVAPADVVMDRAFTVDAPVEQVWPWLAQLGKTRAGWYLPRSIERFVPPKRRALRYVDRQWLGLRVGDVIADYGGRDATFEVAAIVVPTFVVYTSRRRHTDISWSISLERVRSGQTRVFLRLRLAPVRRIWLTESAGELIDRLTVAGLAAGLRERLAERR